MPEFGRYTIARELGRGGMATVYLAHDPQLKRDVALKVLPRQFTHDPQFRARFKREAEALARLDHPAIVPVYETGEVDDQPYLVMRYMPGGTLLDRMAAGLITRQIPDILRRVAAALDAAHGRGMVHRDLKPSNILFDQDGQAYLADFGVVKITEGTAATTTSVLIGTPAYMSPEQAAGTRELDGRSDVYALGVIAFELLAGRVPYEATTPAGQIIAHLNRPIPSLRALKSDLPIAADDLMRAALAKEPDARFQTAGALATAVEEVLAGRPVALPRVEDPSPTIVVRATRRRWPMLAGLGLAGLVLTAFGIAGGAAANAWLAATATPSAPERILITQPPQLATVLVTTTPLPAATTPIATLTASASPSASMQPSATRAVQRATTVAVNTTPPEPTQAPNNPAPQPAGPGATLQAATAQPPAAVTIVVVPTTAGPAVTTPAGQVTTQPAPQITTQAPTITPPGPATTQAPPPTTPAPPPTTEVPPPTTAVPTEQPPRDDPPPCTWPKICQIP